MKAVVLRDIDTSELFISSREYPAEGTVLYTKLEGVFIIQRGYTGIIVKRGKGPWDVQRYAIDSSKGMEFLQVGLIDILMPAKGALGIGGIHDVEEWEKV